MNYRRVAVLGFLAASLLQAGCSPKEAEPPPTALPDRWRPLAAQVCIAWLNEMVDAGKIQSGTPYNLAVKTCTDNLSQTAEGTGRWPTGEQYDPFTGQIVSKQMMVAIPIAGQLGLWQEDAEKLAGLIREADPGE